MFHYGDRVRVKAGFYQGQIGTVFEQEEIGGTGLLVKFMVLFDGSGSFWFYKSEMEKVDGDDGMYRAPS